MLRIEHISWMKTEKSKIQLSDYYPFVDIIFLLSHLDIAFAFSAITLDCWWYSITRSDIPILYLWFWWVFFFLSKEFCCCTLHSFCSFQPISLTYPVYLHGGSMFSYGKYNTIPHLIFLLQFSILEFHACRWNVLPSGYLLGWNFFLLHNVYYAFKGNIM